jgi:hypothetical protein
MDRRNFLRTMIGGVATAAAIRTFPFRVYSFPKEVKGNWKGLILDPYPGKLQTPELRIPVIHERGNGLTVYSYVSYVLNKDGTWSLRDADERGLEVTRMYRARQFWRKGKANDILRISYPVAVAYPTSVGLALDPE